ncbi:UDP-2,3-diacylglucosamine diphosphatase [hydrothermal vent metagenome]|uniref:UDP-2,3-diacylglucosamine diphosphatase n=1 Tax=hydrothermal vent metagenome TaxID=652676 RepID=A0A3B0V9B8_9ZZZZ
MNKSILFIADCHLSDQQPEIYQRFKTFLNDKARNSRALYILGDLFEYYLGDDAISGVAKDVCHDLNKLVTEYSTKCYFMAGNRDFLVATAFADSAQLTLLTDPSVIDLDNNRVILTHADSLCTDDVQYQKIRQQLRSPKWQQSFLNLSIPERIKFAQQARITSQQYTQTASDEIMDVNQLAVIDLFNKYTANFMIHGHTHRPAFHNISHQHKQLCRMVVGDWHYQASYIEYKNNNFQLITC